MQTGSSGTLVGWKSGKTTYVPLWDRMEGAWLRTPEGDPHPKTDLDPNPDWLSNGKSSNKSISDMTSASP